MSRINRLGLGAFIVALLATPLVAQSFSDGYTFLKAVRERDGNVAERILANPASTAINARDPSTGEGALHILVRGRDLTWLAFMLSKGARPDIQNNDGTTPLILCAQLGWTEGAAQLLARRANPNLGNRSGETPLIVAVQRRDIADGAAAARPARQPQPDRQSLRQFGDRLCAPGPARRLRSCASSSRQHRQPGPGRL